jgi:hypothetical protein
VFTPFISPHSKGNRKLFGPAALRLGLDLLARVLKTLKIII